ncbi:MAG: class I SAM-dependent methyltransferase [Pikeienuella sp.]
MADTLIDRYDAEAPGWHRMLSRLGYDAAYDQLCEAVTGLSAANMILDVGCGSGALSVAARRAGATDAALTLLDTSPEMLINAATRLDVAPQNRLLMGVEGLSAHGARYDVVLCAHVIEHCDDPIEALSAMRAVLRPGGALVLSVSKPHWCTAIIRWKWGSRAYREPEVRRLLKKAGFADVTAVTYAKGPPSRTSKGYVAYANNSPTP